MVCARMVSRGVALGSLVVALSVTLAGSAEAHVKWFCGAVDVRTPPLPLHSVLTSTVLVLGIASMILVSVGSLADGLAERRWPAVLRKNHQPIVEELIVRTGMGFFLVLLWLDAGVAAWGKPQDRVILTPELLDSAGWLGWLQLATAALLVSRRTLPLAALGLGAVYVVGISRYGLHRMVDYLFFLGFALSGPAFDRRLEPRPIAGRAASRRRSTSG